MYGANAAAVPRHYSLASYRDRNITQCPDNRGRAIVNRVVTIRPFVGLNVSKAPPPGPTSWSIPSIGSQFKDSTSNTLADTWTAELSHHSDNITSRSTNVMKSAIPSFILLMVTSYEYLRSLPKLSALAVLSMPSATDFWTIRLQYHHHTRPPT